jgi:hypothetical protein
VGNNRNCCPGADGTARLTTTVATINPQFAHGSRLIGTSTLSGIMGGPGNGEVPGDSPPDE